MIRQLWIPLFITGKPELLTHSMAKASEANEAKVANLPLKVAQSCVVQTPEGKQRLNLSRKELTSVPTCIQKFGDLDELDLSEPDPNHP
ncbi:unnamed protein product [Lampetra planeri]